MPKVVFDLRSHLPPERVLDALTDFTETRPDQWSGLSRELYEVYEVGDNRALIKEGTKGPPKSVWAKELYEWGDPPNEVRWTVQESNFAAPGYGVRATVSPSGEGGSIVHIEWQREPTTFGAKLLIRMLTARDAKLLKKFVRQGFDSLPAEAPRPR